MAICKRFQWLSCGLISLLLGCLVSHASIAVAAVAEQRSSAVAIQVDAAIGPAVGEYIEAGISYAQSRGADFVIIELDTPGGLDKSMRDIISTIMASQIPVITYVAPSGARAASAGTFILYASHVAAMAPGTNVGAATPVQIGGSGDSSSKKGSSALETKIVNDAVAYIRSLAEHRERNADWAEQAVRAGVSISANEALAEGVVDIIASDRQDLLDQLHGKTVSVQGELKQLSTQGASVETYQADWRSQFLMTISDPSIAYLLLMAGVWGLFLEFAYPGSIVPGVLGGIAILIALYSFQMLPINYAGLALLLLGAVFIVLEAVITSYGILGIGGVIAVIMGSIMLLDSGQQVFTIAMPLIVAVSLLTSGVLLVMMQLAIRSSRRPIVVGAESIVGLEGVVEENYRGQKVVLLQGERWLIHNSDEVSAGDRVAVTSMQGIYLQVEVVTKLDSEKLETRGQ